MSRVMALVLGVLVLALPACLRKPGGPALSVSPATAREQGRKAATDSAAAGALKLREYPPTPASAQHGEYIKLLGEKGIGYEVLDLPAGRTDADFRAEVGGWNEVMQAEITRKFGPTFLADLREEADKRWEERVKGRK